MKGRAYFATGGERWLSISVTNFLINRRENKNKENGRL